MDWKTAIREWRKLPPEMQTARRLERVLTIDPGMGVARHVDAGYPEAIEAARKHAIKIPMLSPREK